MTTGFVEIGTVARELGVAPSTLRTWERRYRLIVPRRGPGGQRLYDQEQIVALRTILAQVRRGARAGAAHQLGTLDAPARALHLTLQPDARAPGSARRSVEALLGETADRRFVFFLQLVTSELVNNAVLHAESGDPIALDIELREPGARVRVQNRGSRFSLRSFRRQRRAAGRGLEIVEALVESWTIDTGPLGTAVTVELLRQPAV
jgi:anti-sigma regulatory factor (Ser/Thr protein kinase)